VPIKPEPGDKVLLVRCSSNSEFDSGDAEVAYVTISESFLERLKDRANILRQSQAKDDQLVEMSYRGHAEFFSSSHQHDDVEEAEENGWTSTDMDVTEIDEDAIVNMEFTYLVMSCGDPPNGTIYIHWMGTPKHGDLIITTESVDLDELLGEFE
jgi:hypothetical protein